MKDYTELRRFLMRTMIIEGGRAAPQGREKAVAVVIVFVLPGPVDANGQRRTPDFFVAVGADPSNHSQVWMGIPGGIMTVTSHCPRTAVEALMINLRAMGWDPRPGQPSKRANSLPVQQAVSRPYAPQDVPGQLFLQYLLDLQSGMMRPEDLAPWLAVTGKSGQVFRPCGAVVGPRGAAVGSPCPDGPCQLNQGGSCVWRTHSGKAQTPPAIPVASGWREQAKLASHLSAPSNGAGGAMGQAYRQPAPPSNMDYSPPGQQWGAPPQAAQATASGVIHPPGGEFVLDMSPPSGPSGEFDSEPEATEVKPAPRKKRSVSRKPTVKKKAAKKSSKS